MGVGCNKGCGRTWPRHPAREVSCPDCNARVGQRCRRPSEHGAADYHRARYLAAYDAGHFGECPWNCCRPRGRKLPGEDASPAPPPSPLPLFEANR